jgi:hypothetical protein
MPFQILRDDTLINIANRALAAVGFPAQTDVAGSNDPAVQQMVQSVNQAGTDLLGMHDWQQMLKTFEVSIIADFPGQSSKFVDLPEDFLMFKDQSQWNVSQQLPMIGPVLSQDWQRVTVRTADFVTRLLWRVRDNQWEIKSPPEDSQDLSMEYISQGYIQDQDDATLFKNFADKNGDLFLIDQYLIYYLAKAKWLEVKGFDSAAAMRDFQVSFEQRFTQDQGAPVLSLINRTGYRYLDYWNIPDTNYGV